MNQNVRTPYICHVDWKNHIGEYIRYKLKQEGRTIKWITQGMGMTRQNFSNNWLDKEELLPHQVKRIIDFTGPEFFDEFYKANPARNGLRKVEDAPKMEEPEPAFLPPPESLYQGAGCTLRIEIDPVNFNPDHLDPLTETMKKALVEFQEKIKSNE